MKEIIFSMHPSLNERENIMTITSGINHIGLAVADLQASTDFFVNQLGWIESGYDASYPRTAVSDGKLKITLWQVDHNKQVRGFDRRQNVGLHHLALHIETEEKLYELAEKLSQVENVQIEFMPEFMGSGPRKHFICYEPSGIRIEFTWMGN